MTSLDELEILLTKGGLKATSQKNDNKDINNAQDRNGNSTVKLSQAMDNFQQQQTGRLL